MTNEIPINEDLLQYPQIRLVGEEDEEKIEKYFRKVLDFVHQSTEIKEINKRKKKSALFSHSLSIRVRWLVGVHGRLNGRRRLRCSSSIA